MTQHNWSHVLRCGTPPHRWHVVDSVPIRAGVCDKEEPCHKAAEGSGISAKQRSNPDHFPPSRTAKGAAAGRATVVTSGTGLSTDRTTAGWHCFPQGPRSQVGPNAASSRPPAPASAAEEPRRRQPGPARRRPRGVTGGSPETCPRPACRLTGAARSADAQDGGNAAFALTAARRGSPTRPPPRAEAGSGLRSARRRRPRAMPGTGC